MQTLKQPVSRLIHVFRMSMIQAGHESGADLLESRWEPITSFEGSEHFVENFWAKVHDERDWKDLSQFAVDEHMLPTGPPPSALCLHRTIGL